MKILAVGDMGFRVKWYNTISSFIKNAAVIFVSHDISAIYRTCSRGLVLNTTSFFQETLKFYPKILYSFLKKKVLIFIKKM